MDLGQYEKCANWYMRVHPKISKSDAIRRIKFRQKYLHKFELPYIEMFITTKCNLHCKYCSNLIPYCIPQKNFDAITVKETLSKLLSNVDRIYRFKLHGGEVLLHPELADIIEFAGRQKKIFSLLLATNGTIIPNDTLLKAIQKANCAVHISEYNLKNSKTAQIISLLEQYGIQYRYLHDFVWKNMGDFALRDTNRRTKCSVSQCVALYDGKIFICPRVAMMDFQGIVSSKYVEVFQNRQEFQHNMVNYYNDMTINACNFCDGDTEYACDIVPGRQNEE